MEIDARLEKFYTEHANRIAANELLATAALKRIDEDPSLALEAGKFFEEMYPANRHFGLPVPDPSEMPWFISRYKNGVKTGTIPAIDKRSFEVLLAKFELEQRAKETVESAQKQ